MSSRRRRERKDELQSSAGVDYSKLSDRRLEDNRFERYRDGNPSSSATAATAKAAGGGASATFDAFMRMATGGEQRTVRDFIDNPNRPTWETFKEQHKDQLDLAGAKTKEMMAYRQELDAARERMLAQKRREKRKRKRDDESGSEESEEDEARGERKRKKEKKKKKKKSKKKKKKHRREEAEDEPSGPVRLSAFLNESSSEDD
mmetsp:Transcript_16428/g.62411  ORF Transcript_16428/g.62411 Transcript_16428/m.62411 type:complete len:203 (-) Transcript_16428:590-1198(-)